MPIATIDIVVNLDYYTNLYFSNGEDAPYKLKDKTTIYLKPILVKNYPIYLGCIDILQIPKNDSSDIKIIQMSYLQYLIEVLFKQDDPKERINESKLRAILSYCLGADYVGFVKNEKNKWVVAICNSEGIIEHIINATEFDEIRELILNQNDAHYDNRYVNPDVKQVMEEYYKIKYADVHPPSLEKKKAFVSSKLGKTFKELGEMNVREFELVYKACADSEIYLANKVTEASYKYEVKNPSQHPLYEPERDAFAEIFSDTSVLNGKGLQGAENIGVGL